MNGPVKSIKPTLPRPITLVACRRDTFSDVPLAGHVRLVARALQHFGNGLAPTIQVTPISVVTIVSHHPANTGLMRIKTGEQTRSCRAASSGVVKLRETQSAFRESIQRGRLNFTPITTDIGIPHVIRHDQNDIGSFIRSGKGCQNKSQQGEVPSARWFHGRLVSLKEGDKIDFGIAFPIQGTQNRSLDVGCRIDATCHRNDQNPHSPDQFTRYANRLRETRSRTS